MKKIKYPDYMNSTVSLANSVLKYFGAPGIGGAGV